MTSVRLTMPTACQLMLAPELDAPNRTGDLPITRHLEMLQELPRDYRDVFNGRLLEGLTVVGPYEIPKIEPCALVPEELVAFSEAMSTTTTNPNAWVHWYEDDYRSERFWNTPERYLDRLSRFSGVISPDYSLYANMPEALKISNTYRNQLLGAWMQAKGLNVIANIRLSGPQSVPYALAGLPQHSTLSIGLHGCTKSVENRRQVIDEIRIICDQCEPESLLIYGSSRYKVLDYPMGLGIPVHVFPPDSRRRSQERKAA